MNFARGVLSFEAARAVSKHTIVLISLLVLTGLAGCADQVRVPTPEELAAFEEAGLIQPTVDMEGIQRARLYTGPYRTVPGDVLELTMPALLQVVTAAEVKAAETQSREDPPYLCRVTARGTITLPAVGEMAVAGLSLAEIEEKVVAAYGRYVVLRPSVFVRVLEYKTYRVSISGAVAKPGVFALRRDQMSLAALLMEAGGIAKEGAAVIRIGRLRPPSVPAAGLPPVVSPPETTPPETRPPVTTARRDGRPKSRSELRAIFQREGPLDTTGWLTLEQGEKVLVRRWLDLGNKLQAQAFLRMVTTMVSQTLLDDLREKLSQLVAYLESHPRNSPGGPGTPLAAWETLHEGLFLARVGETVAGPDDDEPNGMVGGEAQVAHGPVLTGALGAGAIGLGTTAAGAAVVSNEEAATTLVLPVKGWNIPFRDVALEEGDTVVVEQMQMPLFCVLGLVERPGNFPYPPMAEYTVTQAIGFAGGLDAVADPRYVTIYRLTKDGSVARVPLKLVEKGGFTKALGTPIKPGDVVAVEHTPRTRMNTIVNNLLRVNTGVYITGRDLWGSE